MPLQFATIEEPSFGRGIDARSAENQIRDGFVRDLVNSDIIEGRATKRKGYTNYAGNIPVRVVKYRQSNTLDKVYLTLDGSIDLSRTDVTPILVYGNTGVTNSALQTVRYFPSWTTNLKKALLETGTTLTTGTGTTSATLNVVSTAGFNTSGRFSYAGVSYLYTGVTSTSFTGVSPAITYGAGEAVTEQRVVDAPFTEHGIPSSSIYVGLGLLTSNDLTNETIFPDIGINGTTYDISATYTNNTGNAEEVVLFYVDGQDILGEKYSGIHTGTSFTINATGVGGHNLASTSILYQVYKDVGSGNLERVYPDTVVLNSLTGNIAFTFSESATYRVLLSTTPSTQSFTVAPVSVNGNFQVTLPNITSPYLLYSVYAAATGEEIYPDTVTYDDIAKTATFAFSTFNQSVSIYYIHGTVRTNEIAIDTSVTVDRETTSPQLTIYGLSHGEIYGDGKEVNRRGWATHLDSYKSPRTTHMVAGLGGNLFAALQPGDEYFPSSLTNAFPEYYPNLNSRTVASDQIIGPAFWSPNETPNRTRATLHFDGGATHWATITAVSYQVSTGKTRYTISVSNASVQNGSTISDVISLQDKLTVKGMSSSRHNGTFAISARSGLVGATFTIDVTNPKIKNSDYDDAGTSGLAAIFTDQVNLTSNPFLADDELLSSAWGDTAQLLVDSVSGNTLVLSQVFDKISLTASLVVTGRRSSNELPLRNLSTSTSITPSLFYIVAGDTLSIGDFNRPIQVVAVDADTATLTLDESLTWEDNISLPTPVNVSKRWIPAESPTPDSADVLLPQTVTRYLTANPYDNQPFLRSAMVQNNMYLTNGDDEVYKYDGRNFYRAGIIPWQPGLFLTVENVASGGVPLAGDTFSVAGTTFAGKGITVPKADAALLSRDDLVKVVFTKTTPAQTTTLYLTVAAITQETSGTDSTITFKEPVALSFTPDNISLTLTYAARYSFRLNIKDINGVTTASAVTGAEDFIALLTPTTAQQQQVRLKLVGMPAWDTYDYSNKNIEVEVYRTLWSTQAIGEVPVFYRIATKALTFLEYNGYVEIIDSYSNSSLGDTQLDGVVSVLSPEIVPAGWDEPPRAKYVTTAGNRLVLANLTDWPTLSLTFAAAESIAASSFVGQKFTFRKNYTNSSSVITNMTDRVTLELVSTSSAKTVYPETSGSAGQFRFTSTTAWPVGFGAGSWVYLHYDVASPGLVTTVTAAVNNEFTTAVPHNLAVNDLVHFAQNGSAALPIIGTPGTALSTTKGYYVASASGSKFEIKETYTGAVLDVTVAGDAIVSSAKANPEYSGWWQVAGVVGNTVTILDVNSNITQTPTHFPNRATIATDTRDVPVLVDTDGNMGMANGNGPVTSLNILRRMGMALNAVMRVTTVADFVPWLVARSESDTKGQLIVKQPRAETLIPGVVSTWGSTTTSGTGTSSATLNVASTAQFLSVGSFLYNGSPYTYTGKTSTSFTGVSPAITYTNEEAIVSSRPYTTYVNAAKVETGAVTSAVTLRYPSRIAASYNNFPEIFDNLWTVNEDTSTSVVDINSADGQEITGVIPFFGDSAFGASQQAGVLVVFKQNSIYLVNLAAKAEGINPVQRLETQGLGCTAPYSIAPTKDGIAFANDSGIYVLRRNQRIEYLGRYVERLWQKSVDKDWLSLVQGHHYGVGRQYKLSVPLSTDSTADYAANSEVYVYNHTGESDGEPGGWARYTNHPATGWANLFQDAFFSTTEGAVKSIRNTGEASDYRDDANAIESILEARATAFGNTAVRKAVATVTVHYRSGANSDNTSVYMTPDLYQEYDLSSSFRVLTKPGVVDGLGSIAGQDVVSIAHSFPKRRCIYMAVKIINSGIDENVEIAGFSYTVAGLSGAGVKQAGETE